MFPAVLRNLAVCVFPRHVRGIHLAFVEPGATAGDGPSDRFAVEGDAAGAARACAAGGVTPDARSGIRVSIFWG